MIHIENITINIQSSDIGELLNPQSPVIVRNELVNTLRIISEYPRFLGQTVIIPDDYEHHGFTDGKYDLPTLLYFLADMLEV